MDKGEEGGGLHEGRNPIDSSVLVPPRTVSCINHTVMYSRNVWYHGIFYYKANSGAISVDVMILILTTSGSIC
ncbi:hypothetical protein J6590_077928 [Homalodisca vitripennis]|nr:hypothetical protein J6590_077928 [Homalodisca vitripennis]